MVSWKSAFFGVASAALAFNNVVRCEDAKKEESTGEPIIGIDLGTTFSCVGFLGDSGVQIFSNDQGNRITPSWVAVTGDGEWLVGEAAKNQAAANPYNTVFDAKRLIGRKIDEEEVKADMKLWPFKVVGKSGNPYIRLKVKGEDKDFAPEQISAMVLSKMKEIAEASLGKKVKKAVVTVPAYFNDAQRQATKDAGTIANMEVVRILNEPTAAAIAYGLDVSGEKNIVVFDLGGGTFDVSLLTFENGLFEVKAVSGDTHLGGQDFDNRIMKWALDQLPADVRNNEKFKSRLRREAEKAKIVLSNTVVANIDLEIPGHGEKTLKLTRVAFEEMNRDLFSKCIPPVEKALKDASWKKKTVDHIVLVGGSTRIPKVQELLREFFDGKELDKKVNPDEAVAYGAAMQAGVLMGSSRTQDVLVIDATPLTLGIEVSGGVIEPLITRNTAIPTKKSKIFSTASDNQSAVSIKIFEGERPFAKDNHLLGSFELSNLPMAPRGVPQIEVTFDLDADGILMVSAVDKASTSNAKSIRITNDKSRLSQADIDRMLKEAEQFKEEDLRRKELVEAKDSFERYLYQLKDQVTDEKKLAGKINEEDKKVILNAVGDAQKWSDAHKESASKEDFEEQKAKVEKLVAPIMTKLYEAGAASGSSAPAEDIPNEHDEL
jgi:endoplasmic reticulum chaperone BiP